jgi:hypothetical protein
MDYQKKICEVCQILKPIPEFRKPTIYNSCKKCPSIIKKDEHGNFIIKINSSNSIL